MKRGIEKRGGWKSAERWTGEERRTEGPKLPVATDVCSESLHYLTFDHTSYCVSSKPHFAWSFTQRQTSPPLNLFTTQRQQIPQISNMMKHNGGWKVLCVVHHLSFLVLNKKDTWTLADRVIQRVILVYTVFGEQNKEKQHPWVEQTVNMFWERLVYSPRLALLLNEQPPLFINWLASPAGP